MKKKSIYLDHAATTPLNPRVKKVMEPFWVDDFANPGGLYKRGREVKGKIDLAREDIAKIMNAKSEEIIFTSGGTESDNLAILGVANSLGGLAAKLKKKGHIITTKFEHHAVLEPCKFLEKNGFDVTYLDVGKEGIINPKDIENSLREDTVLVSVMYANNEIGTVQPISEIAKVIRNFRSTKHKAQNKKQIQNLKLQKNKNDLEFIDSQFGFNEKFPIFHSDACQAAGYLDLNVDKLGVDLITLNGSKIYGPKGVGLLYVRKGINLQPIMYGGGQERGKRPGTENVPGIIGLAEALKISNKQRGKEVKRITKLRDYFIGRILKEIPKTFINGHTDKRLPNNINISVMGVEGEALVLYLDEEGIACSTGSACSSKSLDPSHVIVSLGKPPEYAHGSLRFTLGRKTSKIELDYVMKVLPKIVDKLRSFSAIQE